MNNKDTIAIPLDATYTEALSYDPVQYQYYKCLTNRTVLINTMIDASILETVMLPLLQMDNDGTNESIKIIISTPGGSLYDAITLCDIIDNLKSPTEVIVLNYAYSMGSLILMAGYNNPNVTKKCYAHSTALIHGGSLYFQGNASNVRDQYRFNEEFERKIKEYTLTHSKITEKEYLENERNEWFMTSDDMLKYGLVDEVI